MGTIYRAYCERCDGGTNTTPDWKGLAAWITRDGKQGGTLYPGSWLAVLTEGGKIVRLQRHGADRMLRGLGYTWHQAVHQGRLLRVTKVVCLSCGTLNQAKRITVSGDYGCLTALLRGAVCFLLLKKFTEMALPLVFFTSYLVFFSHRAVVSLWLRWRRRERQASMALRYCVKCGSTEFVPWSRATNAIYRCPRCGELSMRYSSIAVMT